MPEHVGGLDLGQTTDPSALAVLRKDGQDRAAVYTLLVLRRFELKTPYGEVLAETNRVMTTGPVKGAPLAVDQTGVGRPVVELARERMTDTWVIPVTITSGHASTEQADGWHVPKKELVSALALVHQTRRLVVPRKLAHGATLAREMENFKAKITLSANETFEAWREGMHDDLVLAVALAVWAGERFCIGPWEVSAGDRNMIGSAPRGVFACDDPDLRNPFPGPWTRRDDDQRPDDDRGGGMVFPPGW